MPEPSRQSPRPATMDDWRLLSQITLEAFVDDPVTAWIFGSEAAMGSAFRKLSRNVYLPRGRCEIVSDLGATQWIWPDASKELPTGAKLALVADVFRMGGSDAIQRVLKADLIMSKHRPGVPHAYLFTIGVRKSARGQGLGNALLAGMLERCDREGLPVYLENSKPENHGFYASHGFEQTRIFHPGEGAPPMEAMWREPKTV